MNTQESDHLYESLLGTSPPSKPQRFNKKLIGIAVSCLCILGIVFCTLSHASFGDSPSDGAIGTSGQLRKDKLVLQAGATRTAYNVANNELLVCTSYHYVQNCESFFVQPGEKDIRYVSHKKDHASSIQMGKNVQARFCAMDNCGGKAVDDEWKAIGPLSWHDLYEKNDRLNELYLSWYDEEVSPLVMGGTGDDFRLGTTVLLGPGEYLESQLYDLGLTKNNLDCLWVPRGLGVYLYKANNFLETPLVIQGPSEIRSLHNYNTAYDDNVNSIIVLNLTIDSFTGYWNLFDAQVSAAAYSGSYLMTKTESQADSFTQYEDLIISQSASASFYGMGSTTTVEYHEGWSQTYEKAMSYSETYEYQFSCPAFEDTYKIAVYIWYQDGYRGDEYANGGPTTIYSCRYNELAASPPRCDWSNCGDMQCETCLI